MANGRGVECSWCGKVDVEDERGCMPAHEPQRALPPWAGQVTRKSAPGDCPGSLTLQPLTREARAKVQAVSDARARANAEAKAEGRARARAWALEDRMATVPAKPRSASPAEPPVAVESAPRAPVAQPKPKAGAASLEEAYRRSVARK